MARLRYVAGKWPVVSFVALAYALTWIAWWPIPGLAGGQPALTGVLMGVIVGPGLAAVLLDRLLHGRNAAVSNRELAGRFAVVFVAVLGLDLWILATPHPLRPAGIAGAEPAGWSALGVFAALLSAVVIAGVFAAASSSKTAALASLRDTRLPLRWGAFALLLPAAIFGTGIALTALAGRQLPESPLAGIAAADWVPYIIRAVLYTFLVVSIGEETGWRGFMLPHLLRRYSPLVASILIGLAWAVWHLPIYFEGHLYGGGAVRVLQRAPDTIGLAIVFTWLFTRTRGHLLSVLLLHTAVNNTPRLLPVTSAMMPVFLVLVVVLIVAGRMWRRVPAAEQHRVAASPLSKGSR